MNTYSKQAAQTEQWAFVSDVARLFVVYKYGGIYEEAKKSHEYKKTIYSLLKKSQ